MTKIKNKIFVALSAFLVLSVALIFCLNIGNVKAFADENEVCEHEYEESIVEATCSEMGYTLYTCKLCGDNYKDNFTDFKEHNFTEIVIAPTCTERGYTTHLCVECGYYYEDNVILPFGHTYTVEEHEVTCTEDGYTLHTCKTCGASYVDNVVESTGHDFKEKKVEATCTAYGFTVHTCEKCGDKYTDSYVYPTGHHFEDTVIEPTEDCVGYTFHKCTDCSYTYLSDFVRSGETPYFPEEPTEPTGEGQGETPVIPEEPTGGEQGETPVNTGEPTGDEQGDHTHLYILFSENYEDEKYIYIRYFCVVCDEEKNDLVQIAFTSEDGNRYNLTADENGKVDYSEIPYGVYDVEMFGENGQTLTWYQLTLVEEIPTNTDEPTESQEQETPTEPETPSEQNGDPFEDLGGGFVDEIGDTEEKTETAEQNKGNSGLMTGIIIVLMLLGAGAVVTLILMKKKKNKEKKEQENKE